MLLNDGAGGEATGHILTLPEPVSLLRFGTAPAQGSGIMGEADAPPRSFVLLYDNTDGEGRPLAATPVEITGSEVDERYALFYEQVVATTPDYWGTIIPNTLPSGVRRIETRSLADGELLTSQTFAEGAEGTVDPSTGPDAIFLGATAGDPVFLPGGDADWTVHSNWSSPAAFSEPGTYILQLTGDDSEYSVSDTVTITALADNLGCQLGVFDLSANNGINPVTGQPWQRGDQYRLVFLSRNPVSAKTPLANDITYWNQAVQLIAERATEYDLGGVNWKIIGSTSEIDARDNTATNPEVHGTGHPILNMAGQVIVNNYEDLWGDGESHAAPAYDENGRNFFDADAPPSIITGTDAEGRALAVLRLRDISAMGNIRQGVFNNTRSWKSHSRWFSNVDSSVYGMSEPLLIIDRSAE